MATYRATFRPSAQLDAPYAMMAAGVCAADTDEEATYLRSSQMLGFARLRTGQPGKLPLPVRVIASEIPAHVLASVEHALSCSATGSQMTVKHQLGTLIERYQPDELMVTGMIHDHAARVRSFEIAAEALKTLGDQTRAA